MALTYFKRYRMELDLAGRDLTWVKAPGGFRLLSWHQSLLESHAEVKFQSFREELDANLFPCFTDLAGCRRLMTEISRKPGFLPEATWLAVTAGDDAKRPGADRRLVACGTVQGIRDRFGFGAIQNLGITPPFRNRGLGTVLLFWALRGFWHAGLRRVYLEVTADNEGAIRLYRRYGFHVMKTLYKAVEAAYS
jgi:ribosomal protein S18 acetylase RimI-like enzyme